MNIKLSSFIYEYQQTLLNRSKPNRISNELWEDNVLYNHELATTFLREYLVEKFLGWTPREFAAKLNGDIVERLCLKSILDKVIIPVEASRSDYFVYAHVLYPDVIPFDFERMTILMYKRVCAGTVKRYPRNFFCDERGKERAFICLRYALAQQSAFRNTDNLYRQFIGDYGRRLIEQYHLSLVLEYQFNTPLKYLHEMMTSQTYGAKENNGSNAVNEFLYLLYSLWDKLPFRDKETELMSKKRPRKTLDPETKKISPQKVSKPVETGSLLPAKSGFASQKHTESKESGNHFEIIRTFSVNSNTTPQTKSTLPKGGYSFLKQTENPVDDQKKEKPSD